MLTWRDLMDVYADEAKASMAEAKRTYEWMEFYVLVGVAVWREERAARRRQRVRQ